jgi:hypothetical protein
MADGHRPSPEIGIVPLFDRRVEGVHVDVDDFANRFAHGREHSESRTETELETFSPSSATLTPDRRRP